MALIPSANPTVIPPSPGGTYDSWFLWELRVQGGDPTNVQGSAQLIKCNQSSTGQISFSPAGELITINLGNLLANTDPNVQNAVVAVMEAVASQAAIQGIKL